MTIKNRIATFLNKTSVLSEFQHGYQTAKSTRTALQELLGGIYRNLSKGKCTASLNCDLSKAFDLIDHEILLEKLERYGIRGIALELITSYLRDRKYYIEINHKNDNIMYSYKSKLNSVPCGVPQGSILGPLLFIIFVNDLPMHVNGKTIMYADDVSVIVEANSEQQLSQEIQDVLEQVTEWYSANKLMINVNKTNILYFNSNRNLSSVRFKEFDIKFVDSAKLLGLYVDANLKWKAHCEELQYKLNKALYAMRKLKTMCDYPTLKAVYHAYFESLIRYGILFWGNSMCVQDILKLQKKALRTIANLGPRDSCRTKFTEVGVLSLTNMYIYESAIYMNSNLKDFNVSSDFHEYSFRSNDIRLIEANNNTVYNSFVNYSIKIFNKLGDSLKECKHSKMFKSKLKDTLLTKEYYSINEFLNDTV